MTPFPQIYQTAKVIHEDRLRERDEIRRARLAGLDTTPNLDSRPLQSGSRLALAVSALLHAVRL